MALMTLGFTSCQEDKFTESIFDTTTPAVDPNEATAPFDQWLYENFVVPYNTQILYRFNLTSSQMQYQLAPADYKKSQLLAHFIKYLFYDVYNMYGEKDANGNDIFMKKYGPRIFHFIGSKAYSPSTGTETLGYASGGVKITLINVNDMKTVEIDPETGYPTTTFTPADVEDLNRAQFHVMHHEFSHIMHQTKVYPVAFGQVTPAGFDPRDWQKRDSVEAHELGFVTHYASSSSTEDLVEVLSCTITDTDYRWMTTIIDACLNKGLKAGDKERVYTLIDSLGIGKEKANDIVKRIGGIKLYKCYNEDGTELRDITGFHLADAKSLNDANSKGYTFDKSAHTTFATFDEFLAAQPEDNSGEVKGMDALLKKFEIATKWYTDEWGLYLFKMRQEVRERQNNINNFIQGVQIYELK